MRTLLNLFSMLALGLMIAAVFMVAPTGPGTGISGFDFEAPSLDYRSVVAGLGLGLFIAVVSQVSWAALARGLGAWLLGQAQRLWLIAWAALFIAVIFYF